MTTPSHFGSTGGHLEPPSSPPEPPLTPLLILHTRSLCATCEEWIPVGGQAVLSRFGWEHPVHLAERGEE
jgi:hypothetical protein